MYLTCIFMYCSCIFHFLSLSVLFVFYTAFATLYVGLLFYIAKEDDVDQSAVVLLGSLFSVGINVMYLLYAIWEIILFYASDNSDVAKKIMMVLDPCCNKCCRRNKKRKAKAKRVIKHNRKLERQATQRLKMLNALSVTHGGGGFGGGGGGGGSKSKTKVTPVLHANEHDNLRTWGNKT